MPDALTTIDRSNLPPREKSYLHRLLESGTKVSARARSAAHEGATLFRDSAEMGATAVALSAVDVYRSNGGLLVGSHNVPIDGVVALLGLGGSLLASGHEAQPTLRNVGKGALTVFLFRASHHYFEERQAASGQGTSSGALTAGPSATPAMPATQAAGGSTPSPAGGSTASFGQDPYARLMSSL